MCYIYQLLKHRCLGPLSTASWCTKPGWKHYMQFCIEPSLEMIMAFRVISDFLLIRHPPPFFLYTNSHSHSLPCFSLYDVRAVAVLTVADKIGQLRHLGERLLACEKHVRVLHSMAQGFSLFVCVFISGNRIGQVADKWQGGEEETDDNDRHFTPSNGAYHVGRSVCPPVLSTSCQH